MKDKILSSLTIWAAVVVISAVYLSTLIWHINGSDSEYTIDTSEFQLALPLWGTVHHTGYPLYMMLGSPFVTVLRWAGVEPAAGASLLSLLFEAGSVALVALILVRLTRHPLLSALTALVASLTLSIWMHGSIAEVYSMWLFLAFWVLLLTLDLQACWSDKRGWLLAFVAGLGVAHHRLLAPLLPIVALWLWHRWPRGRQFFRWGVGAGLCFAAGFLPYLDMVLRARLGTTWTYGAPGTWDGFWSLFWATEHWGLQNPLSNLPEFAAAAARTARIMGDELGWPGLALLGLTVPASLWPASRQKALLFLVTAVLYLTFATVFPKAVLIETVLMPATVGLLVTAGVGLAHICDQFPRLHYPLVGGLVLLAVFYFLTNRPKVLEVTRDPAGLETIAQLDDLNAPTPATIMSPWGRRHFTLAYAVQVEQRFPGWRIAHHAADFEDILASEPAIYTNTVTIYGFGTDWWATAIDARPYLSAAGPGWVAISKRPLPMMTDHAIYTPLAEDFVLRGWSFEQNLAAFEVTLCWRATRSLNIDYSTFIHVATAGVVTQPDQLVASSDHASPVDGWHPTSRWLPGEIVCDAHKIPLPPAVDFNHVIAGMYTRSDNGDFQHLGSLNWERAAGEWTFMP